MIRYGRYALIALLLLVAQASLIQFIAIAGVTPDIVLIYVIVVALREGQVRGTVWGFAIGLAGDVLTGSFLGLGALTKTAAGFVAGYFYNEASPEQPLATYTFLIVVATAGLMHNLLYYLFALQGLSVPLSTIIFKYVAGSTVYTLLVALVPYFFMTSRAR
jgi:rod shape-determining protein MreD